MDATESADLYAATRARVTKAAQALTADQLTTRVPACPDWTVHNLISHLAGVAGDFVTGNLDGAPRPPWTAVQVNARQDLPVDAILEEWAETGPTLEKLIRSGSTTHPLVCHPYVDAGTHEADLRGAIGTGRPPREIWLAALDWMLPDPRPSDEAPGTLSIITPDGTYQLGSGEPSAEVHTETYELFRAIFGRRSPSQIESWQWPADARSWSAAVSRLPQRPDHQHD
ncbi:uncharacterized protein (TIGR03083 family) [Kribbella orskensis]|uniref:Uncharacterized protein (TIGR03083 family) n=1 Tax=Kribbella orskensis TaxID=2512216 RepID=A0ABY2BCK1_9ACTN|nr:MULTISPECIES: maleylpyruvate isomerase family mycothiol-dependent enzyme [Kribbella]TCN33448.1 uncharacterized protein (TIGR03083 family) [Kribbella sp. VKM Ac-2500]TCO13594.1 uncharacterized protein (TIGR03083 family) [Kribbella orskensis]